MCSEEAIGGGEIDCELSTRLREKTELGEVEVRGVEGIGCEAGTIGSNDSLG
jgi:hypothetical protein